MRSTFKILPYINKKRIKPDGTCAVLCRVSIDGKNILITTGLTCRPEDWDSKKGAIRASRENNRLTEFRQHLERTYDHLLKEQGAVSAELLKNAVTGVARIPQTLLQGGEAERERLRIRSEEIHSTSSYRQSKTTQLNLQQFLRSRGVFGGDDYRMPVYRGHACAFVPFNPTFKGVCSPCGRIGKHIVQYLDWVAERNYQRIIACRHSLSSFVLIHSSRNRLHSSSVGFTQENNSPDALYPDSRIGTLCGLCARFSVGISRTSRLPCRSILR